MTDKEYDVLQYINSHGISRTEILSSDLHLSESTVRRILDKLEQRELIVRFHGGSIPCKHRTAIRGSRKIPHTDRRKGEDRENRFRAGFRRKYCDFVRRNHSGWPVQVLPKKTAHGYHQFYSGVRPHEG
ncbi:MAG TPA: DeoR family transcriptional regulator [Candidatus Caccousia stercoris]|uniref:DeoR family transcriptional regulator n=1 Tax=Candidatus Caccousia stercoris TaxID=2840723 RepID=A0A9D1FRW9_9FIRM|nr:DeoR family transcriptional regulator [Candidatus Caccousia stercoris]